MRVKQSFDLLIILIESSEKTFIFFDLDLLDTLLGGCRYLPVKLMYDNAYLIKKSQIIPIFCKPKPSSGLINKFFQCEFLTAYKWK